MPPTERSPLLLQDPRVVRRRAQNDGDLVDVVAPHERTKAFFLSVCVQGYRRGNLSVAGPEGRGDHEMAGSAPVVRSGPEGERIPERPHVVHVDGHARRHVVPDVEIDLRRVDLEDQSVVTVLEAERQLAVGLVGCRGEEAAVHHETVVAGVDNERVGDSGLEAQDCCGLARMYLVAAAARVVGHDERDQVDDHDADRGVERGTTCGACHRPADDPDDSVHDQGGYEVADTKLVGH